MKDILLYLWQLPQNLLGLLIVKILGAQFITTRHIERTGTFAHIYATSKIGGGVSLGKYIIICERRINNNTIKAHEAGHCVQSVLLGWLYLIVVGLPSGVWCLIYDNFNIKRNYYAFYTEAWADRIAGITRK